LTAEATLDGLVVERAPSGDTRRVIYSLVAGKLLIPKIEFGEKVLYGNSATILDRGPAHLPFMARPTSAHEPDAVVGIAGHRTTHGGPFRRIDELEPGDEITYECFGELRYVVQGTCVVDGEDIAKWWAHPYVRARLVLESCHPAGMTHQRILVTAVRV
jgi:sortase A